MRQIKFATVLVFLLGSAAFAAPPTLMNFQGLLTDTSGVPVADGNYSVTFRVYDVPTSGTAIWSETNLVTSTDGLFEVILGTDVSVEHNIFAGTTRYLGVQVGANPEMVPRTTLVTVPYAFRAATVDGAFGGNISTSVTVGTGNTVTGDIGFVAGQSNTNGGNKSTIAGGFQNTIDLVAFAAIGGGHNNYITGTGSFVGAGNGNSARSSNSFVGGGLANFAGIAGAGEESPAVVGGYSNRADVAYSFIGGGESNLATGSHATIPGGYDNTASGIKSFAAGNRARAINSGSFVWGDGTNADVTSTADNQFTARVRGGAKFFTDSALTTGVQLAAGGGAWSAVSDVNVKENIEPVDGSAILDKLLDMPISSWNYISQEDDIRYIGPMAQDFDKAFGFGEDNRFINTIDADGIALAAAKQLAKENAELKARVAKLEKAVDELLERK